MRASLFSASVLALVGALGSCTPGARLCDLSEGPCAADFDDGARMELTLSPRPIPQLSPFEIEARFVGSVAEPRVTIVGSSMEEEPTRVSLTPQGDRFAGRVLLPACTTQGMTWEARVDARINGVARTAAFRFDTKRVPGDAAPSVAGVNNGVRRLVGGAPVEGALDTASGPFSLLALRGKVLLVTFGYTFCPDVCPTTLQHTAHALKQLTPDELSRVVPLFISVDPARDTPARLGDYVRFFHPSIVGATGSREALAQVAEAFRARWQLQEPAAGAPKDSYAVDHSAFTAVVAPDGHIVTELPYGSPSSLITAELRRVLSGKESP
ncbi:MAG: SCO family protein [Deltaproteobacteria bacterium]|nr:SCO family protein [Deltaproteobacteria bacterium]